jgi:curli production assembly/transport component CsgF
MMKRAPVLATLIAFALFGGSMPTRAGPLVYAPVNPTFGGNPLNGAFLEYEAGSNNRYLTNPNISNTGEVLTAQQQVIQNLQQAAVNAVLSEVAQQISIGLQGGGSGSYNVAGELINFQTVGNVINIQLTDATTGAQTTIQIPVPVF